jgi:hypothetical protein
MKMPEWVVKHKQKGKEIREIKGKFYLYQIRSVWDKKKKRPRKITEKYLGHITEEGLIKSRVERLEESLKEISVKEFGISHFLLKESEDLIQNLKEVFPEDWKNLYVFALMRFFYSSPVKNVSHYYECSLLSEKLPGALVSPRSLSKLLHETGKRRERIKSFLSEYLDVDGTKVIDITRLFSRSEDVLSSTLGHNSGKEYTPQVNLFLVYSFEKMQPLFYRMIVGSIPDVSSLVLTMTESDLKGVIIGDKGFYSANNVEGLKGLQYIFPLKRNSSLIDYSPLKQSNKAGFGGHFLFENRVIWYYERPSKEERVVTFLDMRLKTGEEGDFLVRAGEDAASLKEFHETEHRLGTISVVTNTSETPQRVYELLKSRIEIESVFDTLKNVLNADRSYMRDDYSMEGWLFVNFIALLLYYKVYNALLAKGLLSNYSPRDLIMHLSRVTKIRIGSTWRQAELPKKSRNLIEKLAIEGIELPQKRKKPIT